MKLEALRNEAADAMDARDVYCRVHVLQVKMGHRDAWDSE
jgi:hypothetical protein